VILTTLYLRMLNGMHRRRRVEMGKTENIQDQSLDSPEEIAARLQAEGREEEAEQVLGDGSAERGVRFRVLIFELLHY
jgi:hypothetical protein